MLRPPHGRYERIFLYNLNVPAADLVTDPDYIGGWDEDGNSFLFFHTPQQTFIQELATRLGGTVVYRADMPYADWENGGEIGRFTVGPFVFAPEWDSEPADIRLDPSVVFGNGFHPSTRLCLEAMVSLAEQHFFPQKVMDIGCGTGVLSLAAVRFGAGQVVAVDEINLACRVAEKNAATNKLTEFIRIMCVDAASVMTHVAETDLVLANLPGAVLTNLFEHPAFWGAPRYIVSGFLFRAAPTLMEMIPSSMHIIEEKSESRWGLLVLEKED